MMPTSFQERIRVTKQIIDNADELAEGLSTEATHSDSDWHFNWLASVYLARQATAAILFEAATGGFFQALRDDREFASLYESGGTETRRRFKFNQKESTVFDIRFIEEHTSGWSNARWVTDLVRARILEGGIEVLSLLERDMSSEEGVQVFDEALVTESKERDGDTHDEVPVAAVDEGTAADEIIDLDDEFKYQSLLCRLSDRVALRGMSAMLFALAERGQSGGTYSLQESFGWARQQLKDTDLSLRAEAASSSWGRHAKARTSTIVRMTRPPARRSLDRHLSEELERWLGAFGLRRGYLTARNLPWRRDATAWPAVRWI